MNVELLSVHRRTAYNKCVHTLDASMDWAGPKIMLNKTDRAMRKVAAHPVPFSAHDSMLSAIYAIARPSVRPSHG